MLFKKKNAIKIDPNNIPVHIGFIMDGNGRWAKEKGLPRSLGHRAGVDALSRVLEYCYNVGVKYMSVYALSTENFKRPKTEVDYILNLVEEFINKKLQNALEKDIRICVMGDLDFKELPSNVKKSLLNAVDKTKNCKKFVLNLGFCYGGRHEIVSAVNKILKDDIKVVDEKTISDYLYTAHMPDPDLIVRASGEQRISNFMLWQIAYSEMYFPKEYWPQFNDKIVEKCIIEYQKRNRRFGDAK